MKSNKTDLGFMGVEEEVFKNLGRTQQHKLGALTFTLLFI